MRQSSHRRLLKLSYWFKIINGPKETFAAVNTKGRFAPKVLLGSAAAVFLPNSDRFVCFRLFCHKALLMDYKTSSTDMRGPET